MFGDMPATGIVAVFIVRPVSGVGLTVKMDSGAPVGVQLITEPAQSLNQSVLVQGSQSKPLAKANPERGNGKGGKIVGSGAVQEGDNPYPAHMKPSVTHMTSPVLSRVLCGDSLTSNTRQAKLKQVRVFHGTNIVLLS